MKYLLDTNICIAYLNQKDENLLKRLKSHKTSDFVLCSIVKAELFFGARNSAKIKENLEILNHFFAPFESLPFDDQCSTQYGIIRSQLEAKGKPIGPNDMLIASIALANDLILITRNTKEFERIPDLRIEEW